MTEYFLKTVFIISSKMAFQSWHLKSSIISQLKRALGSSLTPPFSSSSLVNEITGFKTAFLSLPTANLLILEVIIAPCNSFLICLHASILLPKPFFIPSQDTWTYYYPFPKYFIAPNCFPVEVRWSGLLFMVLKDLNPPFSCLHSF